MTDKTPAYDHRNTTAVEIIFTKIFEQIELREEIYVQEMVVAYLCHIRN